MLAFSGRLGKYLAAADLCGRSLDCFSPYEWIRTRGTDCLAFQGGLLTAYEVAWQFEFISLRQAMGQPGGSRPRWRRTAQSETQKRKSRLSRIRLLVARLALLPDDGDYCRVVEASPPAAAIERKPNVGTTRMDSRQTATGALANIARTLQKEFLQPARCCGDLCGERQRGCSSPVKRLTICSITASALANVSSFVSGKIGCGMKTIS